MTRERGIPASVVFVCMNICVSECVCVFVRERETRDRHDAYRAMTLKHFGGRSFEALRELRGSCSRDLTYRKRTGRD